MPALISTSILNSNFTDIKSTIKLLEAAGTDMIHCDVMDGSFVKNITFGMKMVNDIKSLTNIPLDVHLMIFSPERYVVDFCKAGADTISFHPNSTDNIEECLENIKSRDVKSGLAISPDVKVYSIKPYCYLLDTILLMSVYPGFGGQKFIKKTFDKLQEAVELKNNANHKINVEVDGGIGFDNAQDLIQNGADILVVGSAIINSKDKKVAIDKLKGA